tara:strand:- start:167 stop:814 length:648 start_codon:yes stop_codon:yes gene_type:complete
MTDDQTMLFRPFGPTIFKVVIPEKIVEELNNYVEKIILDKEKSKKLDHGHRLAGQVTQEFALEKDFMIKIGWGKFLAESTKKWIDLHTQRKKQVTKFNILNSWIVRQYKNEYNPTHWHGGHVSGAGFLKVPKDLGIPIQKNKENNEMGKLQFVHGSRMFLCSSTFKVTPKVGDFYFFPHYLMHQVWPFINTDEERRSISFNAEIDENIYNVYGKK